MGKYFSKFPTIYYANNFVKNILAKVDITQYTRDKAKGFYPHTLHDGERIENLSFDYYDHADYEWLINLTNQVIDPYYDNNLSVNDFTKYIEKKYGTLEKAVNKIVCYRNNWQGDTSEISVSQYTALTDIQKKYWSPVVNPVNNTILHYIRKAEDWEISTNKIIQIEITANTDVFTVGERIIQTSNSSNKGVLTFANSSVLTLQHIIGEFPNTAFSVEGEDSGAVANTDVDSVTTLQNNLSAAEEIYWSYVNAYDYEEELNNQKRNINLIDKAYKSSIEKDMKSLMGS